MSVIILSGIGRWPFGMPVPGPNGPPHPAFYAWWVSYWLGAQREWAEAWLAYLDRLEKRRTAPDVPIARDRETV